MMSTAEDRGPRCLGAPAFHAPGCGAVRRGRASRDGRLRWCCKRCADELALRYDLAGSWQLALPLEVFRGR